MTTPQAPPPPNQPAPQAGGPMPSSVATAQKLVYAYIAIVVIQTIIAFVAADAPRSRRRPRSSACSTTS